MFPVPVFCAINTLVEFKRHFLLRLCKIEADAWFSYFYQVLECAFAEIEDIAVALPDGARRTPVSFTSSPGCLRLEAGGIVVSGRRRCRGGVVLPAVGPLSPMMTRALPLTRRTLQGC